MLTGLMFFLALVLCLLCLVAWLVVGGVYLLVRHVRRDYVKQGGAKEVVPRVVLGTASHFAAKAIRKRFLGL